MEGARMKTLEEIVAGGNEAPVAGGTDTAPNGDADAGHADPGEAPAGGEGGPEAPGEAPDFAAEVPGRMVPVSALIDERRKRRAAEMKLARQGPETAPGGVPAFREDPEGYLKALEGTVAAELAAVRVDAAESAARSRYPDFDQKARAFARLATARPGLVAAMEAAPDPAEFAYRVGAQALGLAPAGARPAAFPESLSESPSAEGPPAAGWRPKSLSEIVGGR
jgi:hypothetical protein